MGGKLVSADDVSMGIDGSTGRPLDDVPEERDSDGTRVSILVALVSRVLRGPGPERSKDPAQIKAWAAEIRATIREELEVGSSRIYRVRQPGADIVLVLLGYLDTTERAAATLAAEIAAGS